MLAGPPGSQRPVWQDASEDVFADDSDEEFTPEELRYIRAFGFKC